MTDKVKGIEPQGNVEDLTPRQQQILRLMQEGKVNKDIARELDISIGTVKQHLVSIFKKLHVKNRTMAVARLAEFKDQSGFDQVFHGETLMAMRPCIVLSVKLNGPFPRAALKAFHTCLSEMAFDCNAFFISSESGEGDLIFGLKRSSAQDMRLAILVAGHLHKLMRDFISSEYRQEKQNFIQGALVAGLVTISQNRFGGWSGENVGSHVLTWGHKLRDAAIPGHLFLDQPVQGVMQAFDIRVSDNLPEQLRFEELISLNHWNTPDLLPMVGRDDALEQLGKLLAGQIRILLLEGENGMGKSRLCREAGRLAEASGLSMRYIRVLPTGYLDCSCYEYFDTWVQLEAQLITDLPSLLILDDAHHLLSEDKPGVTSFLNRLSDDARVLVSGRQPQEYLLDCSVELQVKRIHLMRLDESDLNIFFDEQEVSADMVERCRGIPLFARELSLDHSSNISLALLITVASRIDKFKVDWKLLYCVAAHDAAVSVERLSDLMQDDIAYIEAALERAEALGILSVTDRMAIFKHPLVKDVVHYLFKPHSPTIAASRNS